ncbi:MAG: hypothetical protein ACOC7S_02935 [Planctomycetota bacterium]
MSTDPIATAKSGCLLTYVRRGIGRDGPGRALLDKTGYRQLAQQGLTRSEVHRAARRLAKIGFITIDNSPAGMVVLLLVQKREGAAV